MLTFLLAVAIFGACIFVGVMALAFFAAFVLRNLD